LQFGIPVNIGRHLKTILRWAILMLDGCRGIFRTHGIIPVKNAALFFGDIIENPFYHVAIFQDCNPIRLANRVNGQIGIMLQQDRIVRTGTLKPPGNPPQGVGF